MYEFEAFCKDSDLKGMTLCQRQESQVYSLSLINDSILI